MFFSSLSLALITLFQAIVFFITAFRLVVAINNQRIWEDEGRDATHLVNGTGWLAIGMKLGAIETMVGFGGGGFGVVLTRRLLRFIARACLCIAIVKGSVILVCVPLVSDIVDRQRGQSGRFPCSTTRALLRWQQEASQHEAAHLQPPTSNIPTTYSYRYPVLHPPSSNTITRPRPRHDRETVQTMVDCPDG